MWSFSWSYLILVLDITQRKFVVDLVGTALLIAMYPEELRVFNKLYKDSSELMLQTK